MNDQKTSESLKKKASKPSWWNDSLETSWEKVRAHMLAEWNKAVEGKQKLEHQIAEEALAFGHGAREAYPKLLAWTGELEDKLKADWKRTHKNASETWEQVQNAVKHGWEATKRAVTPASRSSGEQE